MRYSAGDRIIINGLIPNTTIGQSYEITRTNPVDYFITGDDGTEVQYPHADLESMSYYAPVMNQYYGASGHNYDNWTGWPTRTCTCGATKTNQPGHSYYCDQYDAND